MEATKACMVLAFASLAFFAFLNSAFASDPNILSDFILPDGVSASPYFFTFNGLRSALMGDYPSPGSFKVTKASLMEFPALNGQSVSTAVLQFGPGGINPLHTHPRSAELLTVIDGSLIVGLVDSTNKLFTQVLQRGDAFVFPKGLVHFQINQDPNYKAVAISSFGSSNAGTVTLPKSLFASGIDTVVLQKSFKTDADTIQKLVSANTIG